MGREFELKFRGTPEAFTAIQEAYGDFTPIAMETTYYDTFDGKLSNARWTLRRRYENGRSVCTLKTPDETGGRGEWEVESPGIMSAIPALCKLGAPIQLMVLTVNGIGPVCGAKFTRLAKTLDIPGGTVELALDRGVLQGGGKEMPLLEIEVELKAGSDRATLDFAEALAKRHGLQPENRSKYRRALGLARGEA